MHTENKGSNPSESRVQELQKMYTSFNEKQMFQDRLNNERFPHQLPESVWDIFFGSRGSATAATLGGSIESYLRLMRLKEGDEITYMDAAGILNYIESLSPETSKVAVYEAFLRALEDAHKIATDHWQVDTGKWRDEIADEKIKLKEFVQNEIAKVNASIKGKKKGKHVQMHQN